LDRPQHGVLGLAQRIDGGQRDGRRRIAPDGLQDDRGATVPHVTQLLRHQETVLLVAHHDGLAERRHAAEAFQRLLEQRELLIGERQELLGIELAGDRPQAAAAPRSRRFSAPSSAPPCAAASAPTAKVRPRRAS